MRTATPNLGIGINGLSNGLGSIQNVLTVNSRSASLISRDKMENVGKNLVFTSGSKGQTILEAEAKNSTEQRESSNASG